jgi:hypothetical protein
MGNPRSTRVDLVASTAVVEDAADWLRSVGFVEIDVPREEQEPALAPRAPSEVVVPVTRRRPTRRALALGALAVVTVSGCASARWVAPFLDAGSSALAVAFAAAALCALAGAWFGARAWRAT